MWQRISALSIVLTLSIGLSGCLFKAFHPTIAQGNIITDTNINSIHTGTSVAEVVNMLGEPVLKNIYPNGQLAYVYTLQVKGGKVHKRYLVLYFRNGRVVQKEASKTWPDLPQP